MYLQDSEGGGKEAVHGGGGEVTPGELLSAYTPCIYLLSSQLHKRQHPDYKYQPRRRRGGPDSPGAGKGGWGQEEQEKQEEKQEKHEEKQEKQEERNLVVLTPSSPQRNR